MKSWLTFAILFLASIPAFSQNFRLQLTGGTVEFGSSPLHIAVSPNTEATQGQLAKELPPATIACKPDEAATLAGQVPFIIRGTTMEFGHQWQVEFVFPGPPTGANQGNLSISSTNWELTGKYRMTIRDTVTGSQCSTVVAMSGEYQFAGVALSGWPHACPKPTNSPGQSPGLTGTIALHGHANMFPVFAPGGTCSGTLASQANGKIAGHGFDVVTLNYNLEY